MGERKKETPPTVRQGEWRIMLKKKLVRWCETKLEDLAPCKDFYYYVDTDGIRKACTAIVNVNCSKFVDPDNLKCPTCGKKVK